MMPRKVMFGVAVLGASIFVMRGSARSLASFVSEMLSSDPSVESDVARDAFDECEIVPLKPVPGHTHAQAACLRSSVTAAMFRMASYCGVRLYIVQMSKSDQRKDLAGSRDWRWSKDTKADVRNDKMQKNDFNYLCDVDYYVDMPHMLASDPKTTALYTVVPEQAVINNVDSHTAWFDVKGVLHSIVHGSGSYQHYLWDYASDNVLACKKFLGIPYRVVPYAVERKQVAMHRQLIMLTPLRVFNGVAALLAYFLLDGKELKRFQPIVKSDNGEKFVRFRVHTPEGTKTTTAKPDSMACATVDSDVDDSIATVKRLGTANLMLPTTASWVGGDRMAAAVLTEYHRTTGPRLLPTVYPVCKAVRAYQFEPKVFNQEDRPKLDAFMNPFVHGAYAPVPNAAGERRCVEGRINSLKKEEPKPSTFRDRCVEEFATLIAQGHILEPVGYDVIADKQTNPAQKLSLAKAVVAGPTVKNVLKCFIKAEAYSGPKDPRNISTYNDRDKLSMAQFALSLAKHCKQFTWYGPGKKPLEIAQRVAEICADAEYVNVSDYHRMDGTISYALRQVERVLCMKVFAQHRIEVNDLLKRNVDNTGYLPQGTTFNQESSHGSGCSATSLFQTLRGAFASYLAYRLKGLSKEGAFESLGIHLGDDGLDPDLPIHKHQQAAKLVGLVLEAGIVARGDRGVNFLARYYSPNVWYGALDSMCDFKRQISKLHTTVRLPENVKPEHKMVEKAMSYLTTDSSTPVIGAYCRRVLVLSTYRPKTPLGIGTWWSKFACSDQYPNENVDGWMDVELAVNFPEFDRSIFDEWMDTVGTIEEALTPPLCSEIEPVPLSVVPVVVDDQVYPPKTPSDEMPSPRVKGEARRTRRPQRRTDSVRAGTGSRRSRRSRAPKKKDAYRLKN
jgi:hypothetical protein